MTVVTRRQPASHKLTPREFAEELGIKQSLVYKWIERRKIYAIKFGFSDHPMILIDRDQIEVAKGFME